MTNYQYITALHGNEHVPVGALADLGIPQIIGNPKAFARRKRYLDSDLNSAFGKNPIDYETKRAEELLKFINPNIPVIDIHSFTNPSPPFVIVVDLAMIALAQKTGINRVVYMKHNIKAGGALINHRSGISVEVGTHNTNKSFTQTQELVYRLKSNKSNSIELFEVYDVISKPGTYKNFELHKDGFYPILAGQSSYQHFGLKAKKVEG